MKPKTYVYNEDADVQAGELEENQLDSQKVLVRATTQEHLDGSEIIIFCEMMMDAVAVGETGCEKNEFVAEEKKKSKFTLKQKLSLIMLALADFMSSCSMSLMSPFYPAESAQKGVPQSISGLVFGAYALVMFLTSPIFGKVLPKFGAKFIFITGLFVSGTASMLFGLLQQIDSYALFVTFSFIIRILQALGASAYATAGYVLIINIFPDNAGAVRGLLETFVGLGLCAGPGIGGLLYAFGGFGLPFFVVGIITVGISLLNIFLLAPAEKNDVEKGGSLINLLKIPGILVTCLIMILTSMTASYLDPTLEPHLRQFNLSPSQVALFFLILFASYGIFSPIWGWLSDKINNYTWLMTMGLFCNSGVLLFLGPSPIFTFLDGSLWLDGVSLAVLGIFEAMAIIPTYQFILDSALDNGLQENLGTHSLIAGIWSSVYSLGELVGPVMGATLMENFGFPITSTVFAIFNFVGAIVAFASFRLRKVNQKMPSEKEGVDNIICYIEGGIDSTACQRYTKSANDDTVSGIKL